MNIAREIELTFLENSEPIRKNIEPKEKTYCTYCRKRNHSADVCFKQIEQERKGKQEEVKLSCYGCGATGYYRSNCPTCNNKTVSNMESPKELDFISIHTTIVGRNDPSVNMNVNGLNGEAYMDTAARTSVAGHYFFKN
ncbi:hypothetical protein CVS40_11969 [Lucilia cuprina]|nr:hypothetical protein CVS40_11969 [Lucilia cuprina]